MGDSGLKMMAASPYVRHQMAATPPIGANFLHMPRTVIFPPMKNEPSKITMAISDFEIDVDKIAMDVVQMIRIEPIKSPVT